MRANNKFKPDAETTRKLIVEVSGPHRSKLERFLHRQIRVANSEQVADAIQEACARAEVSCHGTSMAEVYTWIRTTATNELRRIVDRANREWPSGFLSAFENREDLLVPSAADEFMVEEEQRQLETMARTIVDELPVAHRDVLALYVHGHKRPQIANHLGTTNGRVKRRLEGAMSVGRKRFLTDAGSTCGGDDDFVARVAFGLASPEQTTKSKEHRSSCTQCLDSYEKLQGFREWLPALLPLPPIATGVGPSLHRIGQRVGDSFHGVRDQVVQGVAAVRQHVVDATSSAKEHATAVYSRVGDPTPLAAMRPGTAAAAVAGCLAIGGGAGYCAKEAIDPIGGFASKITKNDDTKRKVRKAQAAQTPAVPVVQPPPTPTTAPPVTTTTAPVPPPTPEDEFDPSAAQAVTARRSPTKPKARPAAVPAGSPGEFDF